MGASAGSNPATQFSPQAGNAAMADAGNLTGFTQQNLDPQFWKDSWLTDKYAGQLLTNAFDPQKALYGRTLQQVTDQTNSGLAARGLGNTPYGAAAEGSAVSNFNIDWQNNQLQREISGLGAQSSAYSNLINAGATAQQPEEAALSGYVNLENIASQAQTAQNAQQLQASESGMSALSSLGSSIGSKAGAGFGGGGGG